MKLLCAAGTSGKKTVFCLVENISYEPCLHSIHCQLDPTINPKTYTFLRSHAKCFNP